MVMWAISDETHFSVSTIQQMFFSLFRAVWCPCMCTTSIWAELHLPLGATCSQRVDTCNALTLWLWEKHFWDRSLLSEFFLTLHSLFCQVYTIQMTTSPKYPIRSNALWEVHSSFSWMLQSSPSPNSWSHLLLLHLCWREHFQSTLNRGSYRFQEDA